MNFHTRTLVAAGFILMTAHLCDSMDSYPKWQNDLLYGDPIEGNFEGTWKPAKFRRKDGHPDFVRIEYDDTPGNGIGYTRLWCAGLLPSGRPLRYR